MHFVSWDQPYPLTIKKFKEQLFSSLKYKSYKQENFTVHKLRRLPFFWPKINGILFKHQLTILSRKLNIDWIITQGYTNEMELPKDIPHIYDMNDDQVAFAEVYGSFIYRIGFRLLQVKKTIEKQCKEAQAVLVVSEPLANIAKSYNTNVHKLSNGVSKKVISKVKSSKSQVIKDSIVYVSSFNQWARPIEAIKAVINLKKVFPKIQLTLIGDGTEVSKIIDYIKVNKLEDTVHYLGSIYDQDRLFKIVNQHQVCLNISEKNKLRDAASPIKVFEYTALGKKVVSTDLDEVISLGFPNVEVFKYSTIKSLQTAVEKALKSEDNYDKIGSLVLNTYSWEGIARKLTRILAENEKIINVDV